MNKYAELTLNTWKKWDLIRYIQQLQKMIEEYDCRYEDCVHSHTELESQIHDVLQYIEKCLNTKRKLYLDAVLITIQTMLERENNDRSKL